jgi:hypothetical protein
MNPELLGIFIQGYRQNTYDTVKSLQRKRTSGKRVRTTEHRKKKKFYKSEDMATASDMGTNDPRGLVNKYLKTVREKKKVGMR